MTRYGVVWSNGRDSDYLVMGNMVYTYVVITVCCKAGLEMESWSWISHLFIWGSIAFWCVAWKNCNTFSHSAKPHSCVFFVFIIPIQS